MDDTTYWLAYVDTDKQWRDEGGLMLEDFVPRYWMELPNRPIYDS
jgi:hypothetical protein